MFRVRPAGMREAIASALRNEDHEFSETSWFDAVPSRGGVRSKTGVRFGNRIVDARARVVAVSASRAFGPIVRIGGDRGWYAYDWMWRARGALDRLLGGVGMRRGRAAAERRRPGAVIDCWRVAAFEPDRRLRLEAEMKLPGRAWLEFEVEPCGDGAVIRQTAVFDPRGLGGLLYWYMLHPFHRLIFDGMLEAIARAAERPDEVVA
jgi:hypothetical protein